MEQQTPLEIVENPRDWRGYWNARPREHAETDFFRQVERTQAGEAASDEQLRLVLDAIADALALRHDDFLLDLCCGNGLVTKQFSVVCARVVGVDYSSALIDVALRHHSAPNAVYLRAAADEIGFAPWGNERPTKILMCDSLQYFTDAGLRRLLAAIHRLTDGRSPILFTGVPDAGRINAFYNTEARRADYQRRVREGTEAIGTWWRRESLAEMLGEFGYEARILSQDPRRFTASYRFDVLAQPIQPL
jgi:ubiquinone/menaquinone biosynthesis C-methylase UbiE